MFLNQFSYPSQTPGAALGERDTVLHNTEHNKSTQLNTLITRAEIPR